MKVRLLNFRQSIALLKFGVYLLVQHPAVINPREKYDELIEQSILAERLGFESAWLGEHHVTPDIMFPPLITLAGLASNTNRMTIGTCILTSALYHPLHVAEDAAMLNLMSGGRLVLGIGAGYRDSEFKAFGVRSKEKKSNIMMDQIRILRKLLNGESVTSIKGTYRLKDAYSTLKPKKRPIPIWVGVSGLVTPRRIGEIADLADGWVLDAATPLSLFAEKAHHYRRAINSARRGKEGKIAVLRDMFVANTLDKCREIIGEHITAKYRKYYSWGYRVLRRSFSSESKVNFDSLLGDVIIAGSPDDCITQIEEYKMRGADHLIFRIQVTGVSHEKTLSTMNLFSRKVLPFFKKVD